MYISMKPSTVLAALIFILQPVEHRSLTDGQSYPFAESEVSPLPVANDGRQQRFQAKQDRENATSMQMPAQRNISWTSQFVDSILTGYDRRIRPEFDGDAVTVNVDLFISRIDNIAEVTMDFDCTMFLRQQWNDPRLRYNQSITHIPPSGYLLNRIWLPDLFFFNEKRSYFHDITTDNVLVRFSGNGDVLYSMRVSVKVSCTMDFTRFPMDRQYCGMQLESYGYTTNELMFFWKAVDALQLPEHTKKLQQYYVADTKLIRCDKLYYTGNFSCIEVDFIFTRLLGYYWISYFIPSLLLVILSWVSFWINPHASPARVALGVTIVLTVTTQAISVHSILPKVSYITAIDIWMLACLMFVVASLLEYALVHHRISLEEYHEGSIIKALRKLITSSRTSSSSSRRLDPSHTELQTLNSVTPSVDTDIERQDSMKSRRPRGVNIDRCSRILFPTAYMLFNVIYWSSLLTEDEREYDPHVV
ncbi:glycine receptor subunit alpha-1-like isoform X1 [Ptychodera flava]|uniref:glycine receptor subunit alpha-1-like isoform X1 n=1 Tax=Ptychodera flava TaxID=63121 RepID=UPI00396A6C3E